MSAAPSAIGGIRHLTAISSDAQRTIDFFSGLLGLRLIKQTVAEEDSALRQLRFADEEHGPEIVSFVVQPGAPRGHYGIGGVHHLAFETRDRQTLLQWKRWLTDHGVPVTGPYDRVYFESIYFTDPDGLIVEIATRGPGWTVDETASELGQAVQMPPLETMVGHRDEAAIAAAIWPQPIAAPTRAMRLERLHHITAIGSDAGRTEHFFTEILGLRLLKRTVNFDNPHSPHLYFGVGEGEPGTIITYFAYPHDAMRPVRPGAGMTDRFALSVPDAEALAAWREALHLQGRGVTTTAIQDRTGYQSIALHDPDGLVIEFATETSEGAAP